MKKIKDLTVKLDEITITDEKLNLNIQINQEKDFIIHYIKLKIIIIMKLKKKIHQQISQTIILMVKKEKC